VGSLSGFECIESPLKTAKQLGFDQDKIANILLSHVIMLKFIPPTNGDTPLNTVRNKITLELALEYGWDRTDSGAYFDKVLETDEYFRGKVNEVSAMVCDKSGVVGGS
jgi:2-iminoacetate synthase ThiH